MNPLEKLRQATDWELAPTTLADILLQLEELTAVVSFGLGLIVFFLVLSRGN